MKTIVQRRGARTIGLKASPDDVLVCRLSILERETGIELKTSSMP